MAICAFQACRMQFVPEKKIRRTKTQIYCKRPACVAARRRIQLRKLVAMRKDMYKKMSLLIQLPVKECKRCGRDHNNRFDLCDFCRKYISYSNDPSMYAWKRGVNHKNIECQVLYFGIRSSLSLNRWSLSKAISGRQLSAAEYSRFSYFCTAAMIFLSPTSEM